MLLSCWLSLVFLLSTQLFCIIVVAVVVDTMLLSLIMFVLLLILAFVVTFSRRMACYRCHYERNMQHINIKIPSGFVAMAFVLRINTNCYTAIPLLLASDGFLVDDSLPKKLFLYQGVVQVRTRVSDIAVPVVV